MISCSFWFRLGFRGLSPYSSGILFHDHFLFPGTVPGLVSLVFCHSVPSSFPCSFRFRVGFRIRFRGLSLAVFCAIIISCFLLVPATVPGFVSLLFWHSVPSSFPFGSSWGSGVCLPTFLSFLLPGKGFCSIMISWFLLVLDRVPGLVSLFFLFLPFSGKGLCSIVIFWFLLVPGSGCGACLLSFLSFLFSGMGRPMNILLQMNFVETWFVAVWGLCWCNF